MITVEMDYADHSQAALYERLAPALKRAVREATGRTDGQVQIHDTGFHHDVHGELIAYVYTHPQSERLVIEYQHEHEQLSKLVGALPDAVAITLDDATAEAGL